MAAVGRIFVDIDTQFDFLDPAGKLYMPGSEAIHRRLERLITFAGENKIPVLSSSDDHPPDDPEFAEFSPHCVRGTAGQAKMPFTIMPRHIIVQSDDSLAGGAVKLLADYDQLIFAKTTLDVFDHPHFAALVDELENSEFVVFGVATDYCVQKVVEGFLERDRKVTIVSDAIWALDRQVGREVCRMLIDCGAGWVPTVEVVGVRV